MAQPFVVIKNPYVVSRYVVNLDLEPDANPAGRELIVDFVRIPNERPHLHSRSSVFPDGEPHRNGYDFIIVNPRTLEYVEAEIVAIVSYEAGETHSSFTYAVQCRNRVGRFPRQHQCPDIPNPACAAANCDVLGCKVGTEVDRTDDQTDEDLRFLYELAEELHRRLDETRIDFEAEIRKRYPGQALFVRDGFTGSHVYRVDMIPIMRDTAAC